MVSQNVLLISIQKYTDDPTIPNTSIYWLIRSLYYKLFVNVCPHSLDISNVYMHIHLCVCVRVCVCVCACMRACVRACVCVHAKLNSHFYLDDQ